MKKLYILRGHSGSGKSTYVNKIKQENPDALIVDFNNDDYIVQKFGSYKWSPKNVEEAMKYNKNTLWEHLEKSGDKKQDVILISSNMNVKANNVIEMVNKAFKYNFEVEILTFKNFYKNAHNVSDDFVLNLSLAVEENSKKIEEFVENIHKNKKGKITLREIKNQNDQQYEKDMTEKLNAIKALNLNALPYDHENQTYITKDFLKYGKMLGLFIEKNSEKYPKLKVLKYSQKVFFDNLFNDALLEMRGIVLDHENNIVIRPFKKLFNYSERIAKNSKYPISMEDDQPVKLIRKVNGYLGVATYVTHKDPDLNQKMIYSTTGSLDSLYAVMTEEHLNKYENLFKKYPNHTFLFEVLDKNDPHIIKEQEGEVLIGCINVKTAEMFSEEELDKIGKEFNIVRPETIYCNFGECKELLKTVKHEGFMVYADNRLENKPDEILFKMKSPFYLISKLFGRMSNNKLEDVLNKEKIDEEYYDVIAYIKQNLKEFKKMTEQERISFVSQFLEETYFKLQNNEGKTNKKNEDNKNLLNEINLELAKQKERKLDLKL